MIIIDKALAKRQEERNPIRVALVGTGFMGRGIVLQIVTSVPGMELVALYNRHVESAKRAYLESGISEFAVVADQGELETRIRQGKYSIVEDPFLLCQAENIDVLIEVTGAVEFGARVVFEAIRHHKHVVMMNAELDGTLGPILKVYADREGVVLTNSDGDQPGVEMNLFRFVRGIGVKPVICGNNKGLQDPYRNPTTQQAFARKWGQKPEMVSSFADGTKMSFEQAIVANATGMTVAKRGMFGFPVPGMHLKDAINYYPREILDGGPGIVDYVVGAEPGPAVFVVGMHEHPLQKHYLNLYKLGEGPLYLFYTPYHLCHFETPFTCARAVLFHDAAITPLGGPVVEVITLAKTDLSVGTKLDGMGCYMTYGQCETAGKTAALRLLPIGLAEGCILKHDVARDHPVTYDDVILPQGRFADSLRKEQNLHFSVADRQFATVSS